MSNENRKPIIGFSCGDLNGIGIEVIIKALADNRITEMCVPVIFASNKIVNFYRKSVPEINFSYNAAKELTRLNHKQVNVFNCWEEEVVMSPGQLNETGGKYAWLSLKTATQALKDGHIDALITAPVHKKNIQSPEFNYSGHTPYFKAAFEAKDVVMILAAENLKVALVTEHVPLKEVSQHLSKEKIIGKLDILNHSLKKDFGTDKPKIAVLGLNPHSGDEGLIGDEELNIIKPAIREAKQKGILCFGPYSADGFFAKGQYKNFDAVLAMYHDQGLVAFKTLAAGEGVNYTAGLPVVRTSPDHGTAFDIAGKGVADASSTLYSLFAAIDILKNRATYEENHKNPLRKMSAIVVANAEDEKIEENETGI